MVIGEHFERGSTILAISEPEIPTSDHSEAFAYSRILDAVRFQENVEQTSVSMMVIIRDGEKVVEQLLLTTLVFARAYTLFCNGLFP